MVDDLRLLEEILSDPFHSGLRRVQVEGEMLAADIEVALDAALMHGIDEAWESVGDDELVEVKGRVER